MKFKFLILALLLILGEAASAQSAETGRRGGDPIQRAEMQSKMMADSLSLSTPQAEKVKEINLKYAQKQQEARANNPEGDWDKLRATVEALRNEQNAELKTVLTSEQNERWLKIAETLRPSKGRGGPPPPKNTEEKGKDKKEKKNKKSKNPPPPPPVPEKEGSNN